MSGLIGQARSRLPRIAEQAIERARLTVVPRTRPAAPRTPFVVVVATVLLAGVVGLLMFNTSMQQASFAAADLEERQARLRAEQQDLQMELDRLRDPQRVTQEAQELGMVPMLTPVFLDLSNGEVIGEPSPASALDRMRLRPRPPQVPDEHRLPPKVVRVPVEPGRARTTIQGGTSSRVERPDPRPSEDARPADPQGSAPRTTPER